MKKLALLVLLLVSFKGYAQISVDTSGGNVAVTEKTKTVTRALSIYKAFVPHRGKCNLLVFEADCDNYGDDPDTLALDLSKELLHVKSMLDVAQKYKRYNFYRFAFDITPYRDLIGKLVEIYANSKEWNDYMKTSGDHQQSSTLYDGNEVREKAFDKTIAENVLAKSDFTKILDDFFRPYGYKVSVTGFPDDHQQVVSGDELRSLGKRGNLFVPIPNNYFTMTKIK